MGNGVLDAGHGHDDARGFHVARLRVDLQPHGPVGLHEDGGAHEVGLVGAHHEAHGLSAVPGGALVLVQDVVEDVDHLRRDRGRGEVLAQRRADAQHVAQRVGRAVGRAGVGLLRGGEGRGAAEVEVGVVVEPAVHGRALAVGPGGREPDAARGPRGALGARGRGGGIAQHEVPQERLVARHHAAPVERVAHMRVERVVRAVPVLVDRGVGGRAARREGGDRVGPVGGREDHAREVVEPVAVVVDGLAQPLVAQRRHRERQGAEVGDLAELGGLVGAPVAVGVDELREQQLAAAERRGQQSAVERPAEPAPGRVLREPVGRSRAQDQRAVLAPVHVLAFRREERAVHDGHALEVPLGIRDRGARMLPVVARHDAVQVLGHDRVAVGVHGPDVGPDAAHLLVDGQEPGEVVARLRLVAEHHRAVHRRPRSAGPAPRRGRSHRLGERALQRLLGGADRIGEPRVGGVVVGDEAQDVQLVLIARGAALVEVVGGQVGLPVVHDEAILKRHVLAAPAPIGAVVPGDDLARLGHHDVVGVAMAGLHHRHGVGDELELAALRGQHEVGDLGLVHPLRAAGPVGQELAVRTLAVVVEREVRIGREVADLERPQRHVGPAWVVERRQVDHEPLARAVGAHVVLGQLGEVDLEDRAGQRGLDEPHEVVGGRALVGVAALRDVEDQVARVGGRSRGPRR